MPVETAPEILSMVKTKLTARQATEPYFSISLRQALADVGCDKEQQDFVIKYCAENGFNYCVDPMIAHDHFTDPGNKTYPPSFACVWGVDQLLSRLWCVR